MPDSSRTAARDLYTQAAVAGVAPLMLGCSPWAVRGDMLPRLAAAAALPILAGFTTSAAAPTDQPISGGVAVIPLTGIITPQGSWMSFLFGGAPGGLAAFMEAFDAAINSPDVTAIVIDVDSPGGLCDMVPETAAEIREARGSKPIVAIADTMMCSAAYWIASQADEIVATPSGYAGSVGVYRVHEDWSRWNTEAGIAVTYVHAGQYKVEGNPDEPLDQEARDQWQSDVDDIYAMFVADVAQARGISTDDVIANYGEGRTLNAQRALDAGVIDRIGTYEDVVGALIGGRTGTAASAATARPRRITAAKPRPTGTATQNELRAELGLPSIDKPAGQDTDAGKPAEMSDEQREIRAAQLLADD
jgi:signal peptide peptidase SppA